MADLLDRILQRVGELAPVVPGDVLTPKFKDRLAGEVGLRVFKAMGKFTYGYVLIGAQFPTSRQVLGAGIGIRF